MVRAESGTQFSLPCFTAMGLCLTDPQLLKLFVLGEGNNDEIDSQREYGSDIMSKVRFASCLRGRRPFTPHWQRVRLCDEPHFRVSNGLWVGYEDTSVLESDEFFETRSWGMWGMKRVCCDLDVNGFRVSYMYITVTVWQKHFFVVVDVVFFLIAREYHWQR